VVTKRIALDIVCAAAAILFISSRVLADEEEFHKSCGSLAALSTQTFQVEKSEWVAASRRLAGPGGGTMEIPDHCPFRVTLDPRSSGIDGVNFDTGIELRLPLKHGGTRR